MKIKIVYLKSLIIEMNNLLDGCSGRFEVLGEIFRKLIVNKQKLFNLKIECEKSLGKIIEIFRYVR